MVPCGGQRRAKFLGPFYVKIACTGKEADFAEGAGDKGLFAYK